MQFPQPLVLTNDDGIDAAGIRSLHTITGGILVAPKVQQSACSHRVTMDRELDVECRDKDRYAVDGTPADCVRVAPSLIGETPALLISGINEGANLGHDTFLSGTVAAAREAAAMGIQSISISQYRRGMADVDWTCTEKLALQAITAVVECGFDGPGFWNINLPHPERIDDEPELIFCKRCLYPQPGVRQVGERKFRHNGEEYHIRKRTPGSDVEVCFRGDIAVTWITL